MPKKAIKVLGVGCWVLGVGCLGGDKKPSVEVGTEFREEIYAAVARFGSDGRCTGKVQDSSSLAFTRAHDRIRILLPQIVRPVAVEIGALPESVLASITTGQDAIHSGHGVLSTYAIC